METEAGGLAQFECETVEAHTAVRWFKDGKELGGSCQRFSQEDMGTRHRLVVASVSRQDEGTYSCRVGEDSVDFQLQVSGECLRMPVPSFSRVESRSCCAQHNVTALLGPSLLSQWLGAPSSLFGKINKMPKYCLEG